MFRTMTNLEIALAIVDAKVTFERMATHSAFPSEIEIFESYAMMYRFIKAVGLRRSGS